MTGRENTSVASSLLSNLADLNDEVDYKFVEGVTGTAFTGMFSSASSEFCAD